MAIKKRYIALAVLAFALLHNTGKSSPAHSATDASQQLDNAEVTGSEAEAKILDYALDDLTDKTQYPRLNKSLGKKGIKEAMAGSKAAALRAAKNTDCDKVETAAPSDNPDRRFKAHHEFFVNCQNARQWRFTADELKDSHGKWYTADNAPAAGISDTERRAAERAEQERTAPGNYVDCENAIKAQLKHPATADFHMFTGQSAAFNIKNEKFINIDFDAKNGLGNELTYTGQCIFHRNGTVTTQIFDR